MKPFIFSINATACGGKTTITRELQKRLPNAKAIYFDDRNYDTDSGIIDMGKWIKEGADVNLWDLQRLADDIESFKRENPEFIILDYPFGYRHNLIGLYLNYSIYIDTPLDITLVRRILRDYDRKTLICSWNDDNDDRTLFDDMEDWLNGGRDNFIFGYEWSKSDSDFVVDGSKKLDEILEIITQKVNEIKSK